MPSALFDKRTRAFAKRIECPIAIVAPSANLDLALRAVVFGAVGTAGQRCTSIRRLFLQGGIATRMTEMLKASYVEVPIGDPLNESTLMGPLIDKGAVACKASNQTTNNISLFHLCISFLLKLAGLLFKDDAAVNDDILFGGVELYDAAGDLLAD